MAEPAACQPVPRAFRLKFSVLSARENREIEREPPFDDFGTDIPTIRKIGCAHLPVVGGLSMHDDGHPLTFA